MLRTSRTLLFALLASGFLLQPVMAATAPAKSTTQSPTKGQPWPRSYTVDNTSLTLHQPQLDSWQGNQLKGRIAVAIKTGVVQGSDGKSHDKLTYGVLWFSARTDTDKQARSVTLDNTTVDKVNFPTDTANQARYQALLQKVVPAQKLVVNLDHLESALAIDQNEAKTASVAVENTAPTVIFSFGPAMLLPVDGKPVLKPTTVAGVQRVINTRSAVFVFEGEYFLRFAGHWAAARDITGPWNRTSSVPQGVDQAVKQAQAAKQVDVLDPPPEALKTAIAAGQFPVIYTSTTPTELVVVDGEPQFAPLKGTQLSYITNTPADVFVDASADNAWYVLLSGRWFTATSSRGPWTYIAGDKLPADFAKIPSSSEKSAVLASIPGTPEARESLIANAIPQTATVNRNEAKANITYDGPAQFKPLPGTTLTYAWNTASPVIQVTENAFYAVQNGIWFTATSANGPWVVATSVPAVVYTIPASSPLHYITYVYVYGYNDQVVYVGYTPGYYGTVASNGVVVYGTGYTCNAWIGDVWYGCPATYGYGVAFGWDPYIGWSFGFAFGWAWASWYGPWWGPWGGYTPWYWGGGAAVANVYGRWGNTVAAGRAAAWANPWTGNYGAAGRGRYYNEATGGRGWGYAGRNTNAYTGNTTAAAGGVRYNPETGRVVAGQGGAAGNIYTGNGVAGGSKTTVNTNTGRVTNSKGGAVNTNNGATAAGGFNSAGKGGDVSGGGYVHYDKNTGDISHGGVVNNGDHVYAGKDGNVYRYDKGQGWQQVTPDGSFKKAAPPADAGINTDRLARDRGSERSFAHDNTFNNPRPPVRPQPAPTRSFDRSNFSSGFSGKVGGFRPHFGGFRR
ncbi:hypothetical protein IGB42_01369 [Andreprevotia sp. IGB-42]|uniref:hypothetical protein n=1 Tax=Andreprevotia sp. IGB-42 TaxID=2497473 RepID=UPI001358EFE4|nr:hypothetical protein [Andreprevotia sp. IGB-42]KAF0814468.1 hypothetical protein IGB42_01369 [Andreprevotia sp. IGB-42]